MDVTTIPVDERTRDALRDFRDEGDYPNYNQAVQGLLEHSEAP